MPSSLNKPCKASLVISKGRNYRNKVKLSEFWACLALPLLKIVAFLILPALLTDCGWTPIAISIDNNRGQESQHAPDTNSHGTTPEPASAQDTKNNTSKTGLGQHSVKENNWPFPIPIDFMPKCRKNFVGSRSECTKEWTVFVYMSADNNLEPMALDDLQEMASIGSSPSVDFVTQTDLRSQDGTWRYHLKKGRTPRPLETLQDFPDLRQMKLTAISLSNSSKPTTAPTDSADKNEGWMSTLITSFSSLADFSATPPLRPQEFLAEMDSGNVNTLKDFVTWGLENYPSKKKMLIIWSHGMGFSGGISVDDSANGTAISIRELAAALNYFKVTLLDNKPFDIYASDACLMQSLEVLYEIGSFQPATTLKNQVPPGHNARYIIGSSHLEKPDGWPYNTIFRFMVRHPFDRKYSERMGEGFDSATSWAQQIPHNYFSSYRNSDPTATMTSVVLPPFYLDLPTIQVSKVSRPSGLQSSLSGYVTQLKKLILTNPKIYRTLLQDTLEDTLKSDSVNGDLAYFSALLLSKLKTHQQKYDIPNSFTFERLLLFDQQLYTSLQSMVLYARTRVSSHKQYRSIGLDLPREAYQGLSIWLPGSYYDYYNTLEFYEESSLLQQTGWLSFLAAIWSVD